MRYYVMQGFIYVWSDGDLWYKDPYRLQAGWLKSGHDSDSFRSALDALCQIMVTNVKRKQL